jgi:hypothetical protein
LAILQEICAELVQSADLYLIGCGEHGLEFKGTSGVHVIPEYRRDELAGIMRGIAPDLGLLLSVVPETFSFTLQELFEFGIPSLATAVGSFKDRIIDGVNGFLCAPDARSVLARLRQIEGDRDSIVAVHNRIVQVPVRRIEQMIQDYERLLDTPSWSNRAYFSAYSRSLEDPSLRDRLQVFWRAAAGNFEERNSRAVRYTPGLSTVQVNIQLPALDYMPGQIRLDLGDRTGIRFISKIQVLNRAGDVLWTTSGGNKPELLNDIDLIKSDAEGACVLVFRGVDPYVGLPLDDKSRARLRDGGEVQVHISAPPAEKYLDALCRPEGYVSAQTLREQKILTQQLCRELAKTQADAITLRRDIEGIHEVNACVKEIHNSYSWRVTAPLRAFGSFLLRARGASARAASNGAAPIKPDEPKPYHSSTAGT